MSLIAAQFVHNARNRLMAVSARLEAEGRTEDLQALQQAVSLLSSAMACLKTESAWDGQIAPTEVELQTFFDDLFAEAVQLTPTHLKTEGWSDFSACDFGFWTFDAQLIRLVLIDALMNAWAFATTKVILGCEWKNGELLFTIKDDGPGFPSAILNNQADQPLEAPCKNGTGSGLFMANEITQRHSTGSRKGRIILSNESGAMFQLVIP